MARSGLKGTTVQALVIGNPAEIFTDSPEQEKVQVYLRPDEGLRALHGGRVDLVAIQISGLECRLGRIIKQIRGATDGRILLLARVYEEPIAIRHLRGPDSDGADDYLFYPTSSRSIFQPASTGPDGIRPDNTAERPDLVARIRVLERLATEDDLTGLKNRRYVWEFARQVIARGGGGQVRLTVLLFDIDGFKQYNDTYGHAEGDRILKEIAALMRRCCRPHDVVGRVGGDEFAVLVWDDQRMAIRRHCPERRANAAHPKEVLAIARRFTEAIRTSDWSSLGPKGKGTLTVSGGLASFPEDARTVDELFNKADAALMEAKRNGKDRILVVGDLRNQQGASQ
ncbi:MAG: GGDEF domain-containing protein [Sedimentisphaerales bacterium]|nr:GGDEF domain-containing protein [Sedimentisphaerales bacterium]